jgi:hypothetical protein
MTEIICAKEYFDVMMDIAKQIDYAENYAKYWLADWLKIGFCNG